MSPKKPRNPPQEVPTMDTRNIIPVAGDIIILVMGLTGSGKSSFINAIPGKQPMVVSDEMESCTVNIATVEVDTSKFPHFQWLKNRRLILVDTPGFDDTHTNGHDILKQIGEWLGDSHRDKVVVGGLIYLHDISIDRFTGTARKGLVVFNQLCGKDALKKVVIGTTKSNRLTPDEVTRYEDRLKTVHWKDMVDRGAQVFRLDYGDTSQAWDVVNAVLERFQPGEAHVLRIQHELVDQNKTIDQTFAWTAAWGFFAAWTEGLRKANRRLRLS